MDINEPLHGQIHLWMIAVIIVLGYIAVVGNMYWAKRHVRDQRGTRIILSFILLCYSVVYAYLTFFYRIPMGEAHVRFEPFWSYKEAFDGLSIRRLGVARSIVLNIAMMIPLGYLLPTIYRASLHPYVFSFLTVAIVSILTETIQYITFTGLCELDDLVNNILGALIGIVGNLLAYRLINGSRKSIISGRKQ